MLGRRKKPPVLAEVPLREAGAGRPGAIGRAELEALSWLSNSAIEAGAVLVTGPARSAIGLGLATVATSQGKRVALLECDLADPSLAALLRLEETPGLREYLREEAGKAEILQPLTLAGPASGRATEPLVCIVAGAAEPSPVALLDSKRCDETIQGLRRAYDLLVIDGPGLGEDAHSLQALSEHAGATLVCGARRELPRKLPIEATGLVITG
jgi:MinD-like ATPase involved in chromosome partitioning or flagellar assembly